MTVATITLAARTVIKALPTETIAVEWDRIPANVLTQIVEVGAKTILTNVWNGGGKDATEAERIANVNKKIDAWEAGNFNVTARGGNLETAMRDAYRLELEAAIGKPITDAAFRKMQLDTMEATGTSWDKNKVVPVELFFAARAQIIAKRDGSDAATVRDEMLERFERLAHELMAERAKATDSIDVTGLDF